VLGLTGIFTLYILNTKNTDSQIITKNLPSLITTEAKEELDVNSLAKKNLPAILANKLNDTIIPTGNFYNLYLTTGTSSNKKLITATDLINLTGLHMPDLIKRTLQPTFMLGAYSLNKNIPLLIIKTSSFENTYAGMLTWEKDLERDFQILFRLPGYENRGGILAELTPTIDIKNFQDGVIINKDVRLLNNDAGQLIMLYSIIDKETIIITTNKEAFKEIVNRLNKEKGLQR
jgi:hypothetical protein